MNKNTSVLIAIALPIILILVVLAFVFIPQFTTKPQYNFVYTDFPYKGGYNYYNDNFSSYFEVEQGVIVRKDLPPSPRQAAYNYNIVRTEPHLYLFDVKNNTSKQITLSEAQALTLLPGPTSPDGFIVDYIYSNNGVFELFGSDSNRNGFFLVKNTYKKKLQISGGNNYYGNDGVSVLGWVKSN